MEGLENARNQKKKLFLTVFLWYSKGKELKGASNMTLLHHLEEIFQLVVQYGILLLECAGVVVLLTTAVKSIIDWLKKSPHVQIGRAHV